MTNINKVILSGKLLDDPKMNLENNTLSFILVTTQKFRNKQNGDIKKITNYIECNAFGNIANNAKKYLTKNSQILIEGQIILNSFMVQNEKISKHKVNVKNIVFLDKYVSQPKEDDDDNDLPC